MPVLISSFEDTYPDNAVFSIDDDFTPDSSFHHSSDSHWEIDFTDTNCTDPSGSSNYSDVSPPDNFNWPRISGLNDGSDSSEMESYSRLNRSKLHYVFTQMDFQFLCAGTNLMRQVGLPTGLYLFPQEYQSTILQCFEWDDCIIVLLFEDLQQERYFLISFRKDVVQQRCSCEILGFDAKCGSIAYPDSMQLQFVQFVRNEKTLHRQLPTSPRFLKFGSYLRQEMVDIVSFLQVSHEMETKQAKNWTPRFTSEEITDTFEDGFAWLDPAEFRECFGISLNAVRQVHSPR